MGENDAEHHPYLREVARSNRDVAIVHVQVATSIYEKLFADEYHRATEAAIEQANCDRLLSSGEAEGIRASEVSEHMALCCARLADMSVQAANALMVALKFAVPDPALLKEFERRKRQMERGEYGEETETDVAEDEDDTPPPRRSGRRRRSDDDDDSNDKRARWPKH